MAEKADSRIREMSFSSEQPVDRWFGREILDHSPGSVRLDFFKSGRAPLLMFHDQRQVVGVITSAWLEGRKGRLKARFGRTTTATESLQNVDDDILKNTSVGYRVHRLVLEESDETGDTYRSTDWEPLENSLVGVPADRTVGVGRSDVEVSEARASSDVSSPAKPAAILEVTRMADGADAAAGTSADNTQNRSAEVRVEAGRQEADKNFAAEQERKRQQAIRNLAVSNNVGEDTVQAWISRGMSLDQVADDILAIHKERGKTAPRSISALGISEREAGQYSLCRAILAARDNDWRKAGFELECHRAIADKTDKPQQAHTFYIPLEVQRRQSSVNYAQLAERHNQPQWMQRDLNTASLGAGGALVQTSVMGFDEMLRNLSFAFRMGATRLTGLRDNVTIPRQSAAATAEWLTSESGSATESQPTFVQLAMTPKTVSAYTELSRKLLMQSSIDVEGLVNADLAAVAALAVDVAVISGTGASGQPLGIDNVTGVGTVSGTSLGIAGLLETQTDLATANVMPMRGGYVTTPAVAALMIAEVLYANTASPAWVGNVWNGTMMGYPAMSTNQVAAATMYFGAWENCVVGEWGVLEVDTNPYANFGAGIIGVRAMYSVDVGIRRPAAFTIASSIT